MMYRIEFSIIAVAETEFTATSLCNIRRLKFHCVEWLYKTSPNFLHFNALLQLLKIS